MVHGMGDANFPRHAPVDENLRAAVLHHGGHLQIIACAGSGKTETVASLLAL